MTDAPPPFTFPKHMPPDVAQSILAEAYAELDAGKLLRSALKEQRDAGWDPPHDVQYVAEPALAEYGEGLGVSLGADILVHEEFEGLEACLDIFEAVLGDALMERVEKKVRKWSKRNPPAVSDA